MTGSIRRIFLVRHGESEGNVDKSVHLHKADHALDLSPQGRQQAVGAGKALHLYLETEQRRLDGARPQNHPRVGEWFLHGSKIRLWVPPYTRTRQTADGLQEGCPRYLEDRREHILLCEQQFGLFDGIEDDQLPVLYPAEHAHYKKAEEFEGRFWARMPLGESRFDVSCRVHQSFGTFHRDAERHGIENIVIVCHGVTLRAFVMMWCHKSPEWFDAERNPDNCAIRLIEEGEDKGYIFNGFPRRK